MVRGEVLVHQTSLIRPLFIEMHLPRKESEESCICVPEVSILPVCFYVFHMTVWYFLFFILFVISENIHNLHSLFNYIVYSAILTYCLQCYYSAILTYCLQCYIDVFKIIMHYLKQGSIPPEQFKISIEKKKT